MSGTTLDVLVVMAEPGVPWMAGDGLAARGFAVRRPLTQRRRLSTPPLSSHPMSS